MMWSHDQVTSVLTSVDPVKATLSTAGFWTMAAPAVGPYPGRTLRTPGGKPTYRGKKNPTPYLYVSGTIIKIINMYDKV